MNQYAVTLIKRQVYYVNAKNMDEATDIALEKCDNDFTAWLDPVDEIITERIHD